MSPLLRNYFRALGAALALLIGTASFAAIKGPARNIDEVQVDAPTETIAQVRTARVVVADYDLLKQDFPQLRKLSNDEIDAWILKNGAVMSKSQLTLNEVNNFIDADVEHLRSAYRPDGYGRALVVPVLGGGLLDVKGAGAVEPLQKSHGNGLATTGELLREYLFDRVINQALQDSKLPNRTVGSYAVIDWGFDVIHADGSHSPAGAILRQAKARLGHLSYRDPQQAYEIEAALRAHGLTSAGDTRLPSHDELNIQVTREGDLVDFGGYLALGHFDKLSTPYYSFPTIEALEKALGQKRFLDLVSLFRPNTPGFVQPDPQRRVPLDEWGPVGKEDPQSDRIWYQMHDYAQRFRNGEISRQDLNAHLDYLLAHVASNFKLGRAPHPTTHVVSSMPAQLYRWLRAQKITRKEVFGALRYLYQDHYAANLTEEDLKALRAMSRPKTPDALGEVSKYIYRQYMLKWAKGPNFSMEELQRMNESSNPAEKEAAEAIYKQRRKAAKGCAAQVAQQLGQLY